MAKFKPCNEDQLIMLPISLLDQIVAGTLEHTISQLVDKHIDLSVFEGRYNNDETDATAIHPKILLKVILLAYSRRMISSRQIERACQENIIFIALSYGYAPDHSTIAQFISSMQSEIQTIFSNILLVCEELGLLDGTHFSLDGVKLSANVSKEWSGTIDELKHNRDKLQDKLQRVITEQIRQDGGSSAEIDRRQQQQKHLLHQVDHLNKFLKEQKPKIGKGRKEIQSNVTDNQSAKMPTSHGVIQGYNTQALVDAKHQIIVQAEAFSSQDHENLAPMLAGAKKNMQGIGKDRDYFKGRQLTADSNYYSHANLVFCQAESLDAYIPDLQFRKRDQRFSLQQRFKDGIHPRSQSVKKEQTFTTADFAFDDSKHVYFCPQGNILKRTARNQRNRFRTYDVYHARAEDCLACPLRARCLSKTTASRRYLSIQVDTQQPNPIDEMKAKIDTEHGKRIYARRLGIVEPVFANICVQKRMNRFTLRSKLKVDVQSALFALVHNIGKDHTFAPLT